MAIRQGVNIFQMCFCSGKYINLRIKGGEGSIFWVLLVLQVMWVLLSSVKLELYKIQ